MNNAIKFHKYMSNNKTSSNTAWELNSIICLIVHNLYVNKGKERKTLGIVINMYRK